MAQFLFFSLDVIHVFPAVLTENNILYSGHISYKYQLRTNFPACKLTFKCDHALHLNRKSDGDLINGTG